MIIPKSAITLTLGVLLTALGGQKLGTQEKGDKNKEEDKKPKPVHVQENSIKYDDDPSNIGRLRLLDPDDMHRVRGIKVIGHPLYGNIELRPEHKEDFLTGFDPRKVNIKNQNAAELIEQLKPLDPTLPFNAEQLSIAKKDDLLLPEDRWITPNNINADLGFQHNLAKVLREKIVTTIDKTGVERPSAVIITSGHALAGLAELSKWTRKNKDGKEEYLFDTSIYMPKGGWTASEVRLDVATKGAQLWGDVIEASKNRYQKGGIKGAGGFAIGLNGHRGDFDLTTFKTANIDPVKMLGKPDQFVKNLRDRGLNRLVIVTEHFVPIGGDPNKPNIRPLEDLRDPLAFFSKSNEDLYDYMIDLQKLDIEVIVVSGDRRQKYKLPK